MAEKAKKEDTAQARSYPFYGLAPYGTPYGFGWGGLPFVPYTEEAARKQEIRIYKAQAQYFQRVLDDINKYIDELEAEGKE